MISATQNADLLKIVFKNNSFFLSQDSFKTIEAGTVTQDWLPPQSGNSTGMGFLEKYRDEISWSITGLWVLSFLINLALSTSLNLLWSLVNAL